MKPYETVLAFWNEVWNGHDPAAVDRFVDDDIVVTVGGRDIRGKDGVKAWIAEFLGKVNDLDVDAMETFQNQDGTRVTSRWMLNGANNGLFATEPTGEAIAMSGISIWEVDGDGKLRRGWIELASMEQYHRLISD